MKKVELPDFYADEDLDQDEAMDKEAEFTGPCGFVDWKANPDTVLEAVDELRKEHGLEVTSYDNGSDTYQFAIKPRTADAQDS